MNAILAWFKNFYYNHKFLSISMIFFLVMMIVSAVYTPWQIEDGIESAIDQSPLIERLVYRIVLFTVLDILSVIEYIDTISWIAFRRPLHFSMQLS